MKFLFPLLRFFTALVPVIVTWLLIRSLFGTGVSAFFPIWNDEVGYWHETFTFIHRGFSGGQYSVEELPARAAWSTFGPHGPTHAVFYGLMSNLTGWSPAAPLYANALFIITGGGVLLWRAKFPRMTLLVLAILLGTFWPAIYWMVTAMQESLHIGIALALAGCFIRLLQDRGSRPDLVLSAVIILFASLMRFTWCLMALPWLLLVVRDHRFKSITLCVIASAIFGAGVMALSMWWSSPYPVGFVPLLLGALPGQPGAALHAVWLHFIGNVQALFVMPADTNFIDRAYRLMLLAVPLIAAACLVILLRRKRHDETFRYALFVMVAAGSLLLVTLLFYDVPHWRGVRVVSPVVLMCLVVACGLGFQKVALAGVAFGILCAPLSVKSFAKDHKDHFANQTWGASLFRKKYSAAMSYDPAAGRWGNALLISYHDYQPFLAGVPPGIGLNLTKDWEPVPPGSLGKQTVPPFKSRYLLMPPGAAAKLGIEARLKKLVEAEMGILYENPDHGSRSAP